MEIRGPGPAAPHTCPGTRGRRLPALCLGFHGDSGPAASCARWSRPGKGCPHLPGRSVTPAPRQAGRAEALMDERPSQVVVAESANV